MKKTSYQQPSNFREAKERIKKFVQIKSAVEKSFAHIN